MFLFLTISLISLSVIYVSTSSCDFLSVPVEDPTLVEEAVKYIIFLVDANTLFDIALGMYDFELVLMIAQHAQKVNHPLLTHSLDRTAINEMVVMLFRIHENTSPSSVNSERWRSTTRDSGSMIISSGTGVH